MGDVKLINTKKYLARISSGGFSKIILLTLKPGETFTMMYDNIRPEELESLALDFKTVADKIRKDNYERAKQDKL